MNWIRYISFILIIGVASCGSSKKLGPDDKLFSGTEVTYIDADNITKKSRVKEKVELNFLTPSTTKLFKSEPVVFEPSKVAITEKRIKLAMMGDGYLQAQVTCDSILNNKKVSIECEAELGKRYIIDSIFYLEDTLAISPVLKKLHQIEYTKVGDYYQLSNLLADRSDIVAAAKDNGFPLVSNQDVIFFIDTTAGGNMLDVHLRVRTTDDTLKHERFRYGGIYINPNFTLSTDMPTDTSGMISYGKYKVKSGYDFISKRAYDYAMYIEEGRIYDAQRNKITTDRLLDFGLFKFVNVKTVVNPENKTIDHFLNLTAYKMESITGELELNNRQGNFLGLAGRVTYSNRNIFGGAEKFDLSLSGGLETQFGDNQGFINTSDIKLEASVTMPSVVLPFISLRTNRNFIPKTWMSLSVNQTQRLEFYTVRSASAKYGFRWNETDVKSSFFSPIDLSWLVLASTTPEFDLILANDQRQALSFQTTLLSGSSYDYVYNSRDKFDPVNQNYFKGSIESAGNLLSLFVKSPSTGGQAEIFGTPFAQYVKMTADFRKYWSLGKRGSIASKLILGAGFAYGNSDELPYSRQYSIGGANSLRAFRLRTLGPGEFQSKSSDNQFIDQTGDIKIESSVEYRFPIYSYLKGAFFIDAGNVWLYDTDIDTREIGVFQFDNFYNQIAVGAGFGVRFDIDFLVLRLDAAFPLRDIGDNQKFEWVINDIQPFDGGWHGRNMVFNLGIGYPF